MINKIIKESLKVLILGSILSSIGGFSLEFIRDKLAVFLPLIIVLPALASTVGSAGIISVSKITTYFYSGDIKKKVINKKILTLFGLLFSIFTLLSFYTTFLSIFVGYLKGFDFNLSFVIKMLLIIFLTTLIILFFVFIVSLFGARYAFKRKIDPDDLLIPITTSIADLGSLIVFSLLVFYFL